MADGNKSYLWKIDRFNGGESEDSRIGPPGSARTLIGFDIHADSGKLVLASKPVKHSSTTITKLTKWIEYVTSNGKTYAYGEDTIYEEDSDTYTAVRTVAAGTPNGQGLCDFDGYLYYRTGTTLGRFDYSATWNDSWQTGLQSMTDFAPLMAFKNLMLVANGRYVGTVDDVGTWEATRLTFPPGYTVRSFSKAGSYAVIMLMKGTSITDSDEGYMALWDGNSVTYNEIIPVNGNPHAAIGKNNKIYIISGTQPVIQQSLGGPAEDLFRIPDVGKGKTAEVYPGAIDIWDKKIYYGISAGTSTTVIRAVRSWGAKNAAFPEVSNPEFVTSQADISAGTGYTGTTVQITAVKRVGTTLRFAWKNGSDYGIDEVDTTQKQAYGLYRSLAFDRESPYEKVCSHAIIELINPIATDESVRFRVGTDPYGDESFSDSTKYVGKTESTADTKLIRLPMMSESVQVRSRDLHLEMLIGGTAATKPEIKRLWTMFEEADDTL